MIVTAWFLFVIFIILLLGILGEGKLFGWLGLTAFIVAAAVVSLSAGVIWGGLFQ